MAQNVKFEQIIKIVNEFSALGESKGLGKLYTEDTHLDGRLINIKGKNMINLSSCSYLGLELDPRMKQAAIDAINQYGTLFSSSRIYVSSGNYKELEDLSQKLFNADILLTTTVSIGHHCVMPIIISNNDMVIYDQQAHISMQELSYKLSHYGTGITILRHNRLDELEQKYEQYKSKYDKIWYVIDGVYSMFGDLAPIQEIMKLLDKHKKLHLYVDDAHGISWAGPNGSGYVLSQTSLHPKMIMGTSMAKGFGSCGGVFLFPNKELRDKVKRWGGPLAYSGPQEPATVAAAIASARIHLSDEIYELQNNLQQKISYCNQLMAQHKVPLVSESSSGIFFVACGLPRVGFNLAERLIHEGFYTNLGIFPAVPETCTGVRFTMTNHITFEDIEKLVKAFAYHHPRALKDEGRSMQDVYKAFRKFTNFEDRFGPAESFYSTSSENKTPNSELKLICHNSIKELDKKVWDNVFENRGAFDYDNLVLLEDVFANNMEPENNWKFYYYVVYHNNKPILATFFTLTLVKDDMLAMKDISDKIERIRQNNPYYLTSNSLMMGSPLTNGNHLYIDKKNPHWKNALSILLDAVNIIREKENANSLYCRDFEDKDKELKDFFIDNGFIKIETFANNVITDIKTLDLANFFQTRLGKKQRYQIKTETLPYMDQFRFEVNELDKEILPQVYRLYLNVKESNHELNTFTLPFKLFEKIAESSSWEVIRMIHIRDNKLVSMGLCSINEMSYCPVVFGMDYSADAHLTIYKKMLYFVLQRGIALKKENIYLGITANETKRKFGAEQIKQVAYIQVKDKYNQELIDSMAFGSIPQE